MCIRDRFNTGDGGRADVTAAGERGEVAGDGARNRD